MKEKEEEDRAGGGGAVATTLTWRPGGKARHPPAASPPAPASPPQTAGFDPHRLQQGEKRLLKRITGQWGPHTGAGGGVGKEHPPVCAPSTG